MYYRRPNVLFATVVLALAVAAVILALRGTVEHSSFKAFYCAGVAMKERADPYRVEPLRSCERRIAPSALPDGYVEPAPLPGYAIAPFAALTAFSPKLASVLFASLIVLAAALSAYALAKLMPAQPAAVLLALAPLVLLNVAYGEIVPFALFGISIAALCIARRRWVEAGFAVCVALIAPNVGLPAVLATFLFIPRSRPAIAAAVAALAVVSVILIGIDRNIEYLSSVLPGMADAEIVAADQYSLSHLLYAAGLAPATAILAGKIWFGLLSVLGILFAGILAVRRRQPELVPLLPPACVLFFGIYLHDIQLLLALAAALMVATRVKGTVFRTLAAVALALLVTVWTQHTAEGPLILNALAVFGGGYAVLAASAPRRIAMSLVAAVSVVAALIALQHLQPPLSASQIVTHTFHAAGNDLSPTAWAAYLRATPALMTPALLLKIPSWIGLFLLLVCAAHLCFTADAPRLFASVRVAKPGLSESREPRPASVPYNVSSRKYDSRDS